MSDITAVSWDDTRNSTEDDCNHNGMMQMKADCNHTDMMKMQEKKQKIMITSFESGVDLGMKH